GDAAGGRVASGDVVALLGFAALIYLPVILSLTSFISVLLVVARSYQDSEMIVWFASGLSLMRWIRPVMSIGVPIVVLTASLSLWLTPWASRLSAEYKETFRNREIVKIFRGFHLANSKSLLPATEFFLLRGSHPIPVM
ncbi:MAG: export transporter permease LptF, partial [Pseudomonadota bacterium]